MPDVKYDDLIVCAELFDARQAFGINVFKIN